MNHTVGDTENKCSIKSRKIENTANRENHPLQEETKVIHNSQ
jgi:hypothetical protein